MDVTQKAREKAREAVASAVGAAARVLPGHLGQQGGGGPARQTLTIARPAAEVLAAWGDAAVVSRLLGEVASVRQGPGGRWTFTLASGGELAAEPAEVDGGMELRRADADGPREPQEDVRDSEDDTEGGRTGEQPGQREDEEVLLRVTTRPAPGDLGTEVTCEVARELSAGVGGVPFTLLYRLRALLLTGEVPTIEPQPAAREEDR
ncbi:hypothetical protein [Kineococcus indalonis]|uniref:hypothetical protein n=1 Tax=Kineococcus indalonis TaxID=2696566 RepID=UPI0014120AEB|nr:hypothetical protein [Kineococcus indalonis]NAZ87059.1 hypothetical protein [Kineococcus indalonis]